MITAAVGLEAVGRASRSSACPVHWETGTIFGVITNDLDDPEIMNHQDASKILGALARGIDPATGELISDDHILSDPHVIRALFLGALALMEHPDRPPAKTSAPATLKPEKPPTLRHAGQAWSQEEEAQLITEFKNQVPAHEMAIRHGRTRGGISSRLVRLGLIENRADALDSDGAEE